MFLPGVNFPMGKQTTKSQTRNAPLFALKFVAATLLTLGFATTGSAQSGALLPRFTNTVRPPVKMSPSVNMRLRERINNRNQLFTPARYRPQDGDIFGEDQTGGQNPFGDAVTEPRPTRTPFDKLEAPGETPPSMPRSRGIQDRNPFGEPRQNQDESPFGEGGNEPPVVQPPRVDPNPRTPPMDTVPVEPRLPPGGEFTPDPRSIPGLPIPGGGNREAERARTEERSTPDPKEIDPRDFGPDTLEETEENNDPDPRNPRTPRTPSARSGGDLPNYDDPRRPFRSNVYRPAPDPTYYAKTKENPYGQPPAGANPYAPYPNPYANPYTNPYANPAANPYANPYALNPYMMNPYAAAQANGYGLAGAGCGCPPCNNGCGAGCGGCNSCAGNCGSGCNSNSSGGSFAANNYAGCPTPTPANCDNDIYNPVVGNSASLGVSGQALNNPLMPSGVPLYYVSLFGGFSDLSDLAIENQSGKIDIGSDDGVGLGIALGQIQGKNLRSELEFSYRSHDIDNLFLQDLGSGRQTLGGVGDIESYAGMLNLYWEFVDLCGGRLQPVHRCGRRCRQRDCRHAARRRPQRFQRRRGFKFCLSVHRRYQLQSAIVFRSVC